MGVNYEELATGKFLEQLKAGDVYKHPITRTVTESDNLLFSVLTHNSAWLHVDDEYCKGTMYGKRIVNSIYTLGLVCGMGVNDLTLGTTQGNLGFSDVKFTKPVFIGDTIHAETEVISVRESKSRPDAGIVEFETRGYNQNDELVVSLRRTQLMSKKNK